MAESDREAVAADAESPDGLSREIADRRRRADARERVADERQRIADEREVIADERERLADEREEIADERERRFMEARGSGGAVAWRS